MSYALPDVIESDETLDELMTRPRPELVRFVRTLSGPLVILGAGGKMGPSLAALARRAVGAAGSALEILAVSRFTDGYAREWLETRGVRTIASDLMEPGALERLPDAPNVIYMVGRKFGTNQSPETTWAVNTLLPARVAKRFADARVAALSTGNVYPLVPVQGGGSVETDPLTPSGEYANSCVARERVLGFRSRKHGTPVALIRLSYALDLRYGVLVDIARRVCFGQPVDVTMGYVNCIWQGDANEMIIRSLALADSPASAINLTGSTALSVRDVALRIGELLGRPARIIGTEGRTAFLSNTGKARAIWGSPATPLEAVIRWTAHWVATGGRLLDKPTHFEVRDGGY